MISTNQKYRKYYYLIDDYDQTLISVPYTYNQDHIHLLIVSEHTHNYNVYGFDKVPADLSHLKILHYDKERISQLLKTII